MAVHPREIITVRGIEEERTDKSELINRRGDDNITGPNWIEETLELNDEDVEILFLLVREVEFNRISHWFIQILEEEGREEFENIY